MTSVRLPRLRHLILALGGLVTIVACEGYSFIKESCANGVRDGEETGIDCGGACSGCSLGTPCRGSGDCRQGICIAGYCQLASCEDGDSDQGETGTDCGGNCKPCPPGDPCVVAKDCASMICTEEVCAAPACDDGILNGDEAARDCGGVMCEGCDLGSPCRTAIDCRSAACDPDLLKCVVSCAPGRGECDADPEVECETNLYTSVSHCGDCRNACELANASARCSGGECQVDTCEGDFRDCNNEHADGCETNVDSDALNCGACGEECPALFGTARCVDGACEITCSEGYRDCNENPADGCETPILSNALNCNECDRVCPFNPGETAYCREGVCDSTVCPSGFGNCNGEPDDDCEQDLTSDVLHCGHCGNLCVVAHGRARCEDGECVIRDCDEGWGNCDADDEDGGYANGCETNTETAESNCGACGNECDVAHGSSVCVNGECAVSECADGYRNCDEDAADGGYENGCETDITSQDNCGACGRDCGSQFPNAITLCEEGECVMGACESGFEDCNTGGGSQAGCESELDTSELHCGECDNPCETTGTLSNECVDGACEAVCDATHLDCNGDEDGCERIQSVDDCGACDRVCATGPAVHATATACVASGQTRVCRPSCEPGWAACSNPQDGCLTALSASPNCGECGVECGGDRTTCVESDGTWRCQGTITYVNSVSGSGGSTVTITHALQAGTSRMVLVAVASGRGDGGVDEARPASVTYAGTSLQQGPFHDGGDGHWTPDIFFYYLTDMGGLATQGAGSKTVVVAPSQPSNSVMVVNVVQLNGVRQVDPFRGPGVGRTLSETPNPDVLEDPLSVATSGARIYSMSAANWANESGSFRVMPEAQLTTTLSSLVVNAGNTALRAAAYYVGGGPPTLLATGSYTMRWTYDSTAASYLAAVIEPVQ